MGRVRFTATFEMAVGSRANSRRTNRCDVRCRRSSTTERRTEEEVMDFGKGALLWLLGVPLPIILLLALFWHH
jgi:hypothetical protein